MVLHAFEPTLLLSMPGVCDRLQLIEVDGLSVDLRRFCGKRALNPSWDRTGRKYAS
jgi:hypothetical protein